MTHMQTNGTFSGLIGDIYDAALDPALWPRALEQTARFVGGRGAGLFARDAARRTGNIHYQVGTDPRYGQMYFDEYINLDPMGAAYLTLGVGEARIYNIASFLDPNSMRPAFTRNGSGRRAGATMSWSRWTRPGRASPASTSFITRTMGMPTRRRASACKASLHTCAAR